MTRTLVDNEQQALTELDARTRPAWFARADSLPFDLLTGDEFEVFCYLLIRAERPNRRTVYYGKTADAGRDIIAEDENVYFELVQYKNYQTNVDASVVKADLAKVYVNVYRGSIPVRPEKVSFYVVPGLTAGATDLVTIRTEWTNVADQAIIAHWKKHVDSESEPPEELLELGRTWWPMQPPEPRSALTARARRFPSLIQSFFDVRTAVDNSAVYEIRDAVTAAVEANRQQYEEILKRLNAVTSVARPLRPEQVGEELSRMLREAQRDYPSIDFSVESTSSGHSLAIKPRGDDDQTPVGRLEFPNDALGRQGLAKVQAFVDHGIEAKLDPGEYKWHLALHTPIVGIINSVPDEHRQLVLKRSPPSPPRLVQLVAARGGETIVELLTRASLSRVGRLTAQVLFEGEQFAGHLAVTVPRSWLGSAEKRGSAADVRIDFQVDLNARPLLSAQKTLKLALALEDDATLVTANSTDSGEPVFAIKARRGDEDDLARAIEASLRFVDVLAEIEQAINVRFQYRQPTMRDLHTAFLLQSAMRHGAVVDRGWTTAFNLTGDNEPRAIELRDTPPDFAQELLNRWKTGDPVAEIVLSPMPDLRYVIFGQDLNVGSFRFALQDIRPVADLDAIEASVTAGDATTIGLRFDRFVHIFERWMPVVTTTP